MTGYQVYKDFIDFELAKKVASDFKEDICDLVFGKEVNPKDPETFFLFANYKLRTEKLRNARCVWRNGNTKDPIVSKGGLTKIYMNRSVHEHILSHEKLLGLNMELYRDSDIVYVIATYKERHATPIIHSAAIRPWGKNLPWAWPHDGLQHDKGSGDQLSEQYRKQELNMLPEKATHEAGGFGTEAGITMIMERMETGRFKVFKNLEDWWFELRLYHRKDGLIVKERDDLMSATRIGVMMLREAEAPQAKAWAQADAGWVV